MPINEELLYKLIGKRIREKRKTLMSQEQLSKAIGFDVRTSITNIEAGRQKTPLHLLYKISNALEMDIKELLPDMTEVLTASMIEGSEPSVNPNDMMRHPKAAQAFQKLKNATGKQS